jgi:uncharacterized protein YgiM (DUF1202 family)
MRPALLLAVLTCLILEPASIRADSEPYNTVIRVPEALVRSGPSLQFYTTSRLRQNEEVHVIKQEEGWLTITPPADSFSWVKDLFIKEVDATAHTAEVLEWAEVRIGSALQPDKRDVTKVKLKPGSLIVILDEKRSISEDGSWVKIQPPPDEYRYLPVDAVQPPASKVQAVASPLPSGPPPALGAPTSGNSSAAMAGDSLWYRAEQAERAGNPAEAERLFLQLARETPDHDLQMRCYNRIHFLREGRRTSYPPGYQAGRASDSAYSYNQSRLAPIPGYPNSSSANPYLTTSRATSQYTYAPVPPVGQAATGNTCQWSGWGWLRRAPFWIDNKQAFVLENSQGMPRLYVTAQQGVNLDNYVNRSVNLYGKMIYRGDLRTNYMTACQLTPLP